MIKIFRKIRYQLLGEGMTSKYLKYAIGEIILVVVGILIALQVNNYSQKRSTKKLERVYIDRLINEIKEEKNYYDFLKERFEGKEQRLMRVLKVLKSDEFKINDSLEFYLDFRVFAYRPSWYNEPITWTQLIQSGDLAIVKNNDLIDMIFKHYNLKLSIADVYDKYLEYIISHASELKMVFKYQDYENFRLRESEMAIPNKEVYNAIWANKDAFIEDYTIMAFRSLSVSRSMNDLYDSCSKVLDSLVLYRESFE